MNIDVTIEVWQKEKWFIAKCPELDFIAQGKTSDEAKKNLLEVVQIQIEEMEEMGTLDEYLAGACDDLEKIFEISKSFLKKLGIK